MMRIAALGWIVVSLVGAANSQTIQEIRIEGLRHTREDVVRGQMHSRTGEPYDPEIVAGDRERLDRLGIFSAIDIRPQDVPGGV